MSDDIIETRKNNFLNFFKEKKLYLFFLLLIFISFGAGIRLKNNEALKDTVLALDPYLFLRWAQEIEETGSLSEIDMMRAYPLGFKSNIETVIVSYAQVYLYKVLHFLDPRVTLINAVSWYPVVFFVLGLIVFFFTILKMFGEKTAIFSTAFLSVGQGYLYRTFQGFADKESLGMFFFFLSIGLFYIAWEGKKHTKLYSLLAGIAVGILSMTFGAVSFVHIIVGAYVLIDFIFDFDKDKLINYSIYMVTLLFFMYVLTSRFGGLTLKGLEVLFTSFSSLLLMVAWGFGIALFALSSFKKKVEEKVPYPIFVIGIILVVGSIGLGLYHGLHVYTDIITKVTDLIIYPFETARHTLTVVENRQPYFAEWSGELGGWFVFLFMVGAWFYMYDYLKDFSKKLYVLIPYTALLLAIPFSRISPDSSLNGTSGLSLLFYIGSMVVFLGVILYGYIYSFFKDKRLYKEIHNLDRRPLYALLWFLLLMIGARGVVRIFFIFVPIAAVMAGYLFTSIYAKVPEELLYKGLVFVAAGFVFFTLFTTSNNMANSIGPSFSPQWQDVTTWMRENTDTNAVIAHWWDYGYWVQTMGQRATVLDGGQPVASWNYFMGRHVLTGQTEREALEFLYAHNVTHLLIDPSDIGKYGAYSSIGSDVNYDRLSYVAAFRLRDIVGDQYIYEGFYVLDEDLNMDSGQDLVAGSSGIAEVDLTIVNNTLQGANILMIQNGRPSTMGIECVYFNGEEYNFETPNSFNGCFVVVDALENQQQAINAAGLMMSRRGRNALWTKLYLRDLQSPYFTKVYEDPYPIGVYNGQMAWGPIKVWQVSYPEDIEFKEEYLSYDFPEGTFWS